MSRFLAFRQLMSAYNLNAVQWNKKDTQPLWALCQDEGRTQTVALGVDLLHIDNNKYLKLSKISVTGICNCMIIVLCFIW